MFLKKLELILPQFAKQYAGIDIRQQLRVSYTKADAESGIIDGITSATISPVLFNEAIINSARKVALSRGLRLTDEPIIDIQDIQNLYNKTIKKKSEISTLACKIKNRQLFSKSNIVKVITEQELSTKNVSKAKAFTRNILENNYKNTYHHIGIYMYKVSILEKFVNLKQTKNEISHKLEQLRAMENNIEIDVNLANSSPIGVDTHEDYMEIKKLMEYKN